MDDKYLNLRIENRVGWIEYNRPPINAFNWEMLREVPAALEEMLQDQKVGVVVFASAIEKYFSTGTRDFSEGIQAFLEKRKPEWD